MAKFFTRLPAFALWRVTPVDPIIPGIPERPQENVDRVAKGEQDAGGGQVCMNLDSVVGNVGGPSMTGNIGGPNAKNCDSKFDLQGRVRFNTTGGNTLVNFIPKLGEMEKRLEFIKKFPPQINKMILEESEANREWFELEKASGEKLRALEQQVSELQQAEETVIYNEQRPKRETKSLVADCPRYTHVALLGVKHGRAKKQKRLPRHPTSPRQRADHMRPLRLQKSSTEETKKQIHRAPPKQKLVLLSPIMEAPIELADPHAGGFDESYKQRVYLKPVAPGQRGRFPVLQPEPDWF